MPISVRPRQVYRSGGLALLIGDWVIDGVGREGQDVHVEGAAIGVARRGPDGRWWCVIDDRFGTLTEGGESRRPDVSGS
ncbi:hypothetical protein GCM10023257_18080 [Streptomyces hyderabadensis]|uniref:Uncharacterized protein n=1 Tax=Streptomyces hyderabadensis TaxID=598549 RepID=A0ABP9HW00_9ACTN